MRSFLEKLLFLVRGIEMDRSVVYAALSAVRGVAVGPVSALLVGLYFSAALQGFYYTFKSVLAFLAIAELGINLVVVPFASHEWAHLSLNPAGAPTGEPRALSRLVSLGRSSVGWYLVLTPLATLAVFAAGVGLLGQGSEAAVLWYWPWFWVCVLSALDFLLRPLLSLLEGCQQVEQVFRTRLVQGLGSAFVTWGVVLVGGGLWSLVAGAAASFLLGALGLVGYRRFLGTFAKPAAQAQVDWRAEVWPMQWRIGLASLGGILWTSIFTPVAFQMEGPEVAGQVGMTLALCFGLASVMATWVQTRAPRLAELVARKEPAELHRLLYRLLILTAATGGLGFAAIMAGLGILDLSGHSFARRLLPALPTALFVIATVGSQCTAPLAFYLRAHKEEPFLAPSLLGAVLLTVLVYLGTRMGGVDGMAVGYLVAVLVTVPWGFAIWKAHRLRWYR